MRARRVPSVLPGRPLSRSSARGIAQEIRRDDPRTPSAGRCGGAARVGSPRCTTDGGVRVRLTSCAPWQDEQDASPARCSTSESHRQQPLGDIRSAERWLASLPGNDPLVVQRSIVDRAAQARGAHARRTPAVLEAVFVVDTHVNGLVRNLTTQYVEHREPLVQDRGSALACAVRALAGFHRVLRGVRARDHPIPGPGANGRPCCRSSSRARSSISRRDAKIRLYRCERWSAAKWTELFTRVHARLRAAHRARPAAARRDGRPDDDRARVPDRPGPEARRSRQPVADGRSSGSPAQLDEWCQPLRLTLKPGVGHVVLRRPRRKRGIAAPFARRRSKAACCSSTCGPCTRCCGRTASCSSRRCEASRARRRPRSSANSWRSSSSSRAASTRSSGRSPATASGSPRAAPSTPIVGFANITASCSDDRALPTAEINSDRNFGNTMDLAVFGRSRTEPSSRREIGRVAARRLRGARRSVGDEGHQRVRIPPARADERSRPKSRSTCSWPSAGESEDAWVLGIVRRMQAPLRRRDAEIGLQLIANTIASVDLVGAAQGPRHRLLDQRRARRRWPAASSTASTSPSIGGQTSRRCSR